MSKNSYTFINNGHDIQYYSDMETAATICKKLLTENLEEDEVKALASTITNICFYVNRLQSDRYMFDKYCNEVRGDKNRAVLRARRAEETIEKLEQQIKLLKYQE